MYFGGPLSCQAPLELMHKAGMCCPICWAPDEALSLDRHKAFQGNNPYLTKKHDLAPVTGFSLV